MFDLVPDPLHYKNVNTNTSARLRIYLLLELCIITVSSETGQ